MGHREGVCVSFLTGGPFIGHKEGVGRLVSVSVCIKYGGSVPS